MTQSEYSLSPPKPWIAPLCWAVILASLALVFVSNFRERRAAESAAPSAIVDPAQDPTVELKLAERQALGAHWFAARAGQTQLATQSALDGVRRDAHTPLEQLRLVPLIAEFNGAAAAIDELDAHTALWKAQGLGEDAALLRQIYAGGPDRLSFEQRQRLLHRHGWYAQLALTFGQPDTAPNRQKIVSGAVRVAKGALAISGAGLAALIAGVVIGICALTRLLKGALYHGYSPRGGFRETESRGSPPNPSTLASAAGRYMPPPLPGVTSSPAIDLAAIAESHAPSLASRPTVFLEAFTIFILGVASPLLLPRPAHHTVAIALAMMILPTALALLWPRLRGLRWHTVRMAMGWHRGRGFFREVGAGVVGYVTGLPVFAAGMIVALILSKLSGESATHPLVNSVGEGPLVTVLLYLAACVWAPLVEESMFRGALFHHLRQRWNFVPTALLVAFLFAALHPQGWVGIPALAALALVLAGAREWRGSIIASMTMHAINNFIVITMLVLAAG